MDINLVGEDPDLSFSLILYADIMEHWFQITSFTFE